MVFTALPISTTCTCSLLSCDAIAATDSRSAWNSVAIWSTLVPTPATGATTFFSWSRRRLADAVLKHRHLRIGLIGGVHGLLHQNGESGHPLVLALLQVPHHLLELRHVPLQFLYFPARGEGKGGRQKEGGNEQAPLKHRISSKSPGGRKRPLPLPPARSRMYLLRFYCPVEKCTRRFFCQQSSLASVHGGRSLP